MGANTNKPITSDSIKADVKGTAATLQVFEKAELLEGATNNEIVEALTAIGENQVLLNLVTKYFNLIGAPNAGR